MTAGVAALGCEIRTAGGIVLRGLRWPGDAHGVLLLHEPGKDLDSVAPLAEALVTGGFTVLALDLRGHGASDGEAHMGAHEADVRSGLDALRAWAGAQLFVVAVGGTAGGAIAVRREPAVAGIVLLSPDASTLDREPLRPATEAPMLIVVGGLDAEAARIAEALRDRSTGYVAVARMPTTAQGVALFEGPLGSQVVDHVRLWIARHRNR